MTRLPYCLVAAGLLALLVVAVAPATPTLQHVTAPSPDYYRMQLFGVGVFCLGAGSVGVWRRVRI